MVREAAIRWCYWIHFVNLNFLSVNVLGLVCENGIQLTFFSHGLFNLFQDNNHNPFDFLPLVF